MNILDKIALNRLISTILNFILSVLKVIVPKIKDTPPKPPKKKWLPWRNKDE